MRNETKARMIATFHALWIISVLILPGTPYFRAVPSMLAIAGVLHMVFGECFLLLLEYRYRHTDRRQSMSGRLFRAVGINLPEQKVAEMVLFLSGLSLILSLLRWWLG